MSRFGHMRGNRPHRDPFRPVAFVLSVDGKIRNWSMAATLIYGYPGDKMVGRSARVLFAPDDETSFTALLAAPRRGRQVLVQRHRKDGGDMIFVELSCITEGWALVVRAVDVTRRERAEQAVREIRAAFSECRRLALELARRLVDSREEERRRIARELHDGPSQSLSLLVRQIEDARTSAAGEAVHNLERIRERAVEISAEVRDLSHRLHAVPVECGGLAAALARHCAELRRNTGLEVQLEIDPGDFDDMALAFYRIAQEGLANVLRHAEVREARLEVGHHGDDDVLTLTDAGRGFDPAAATDGLGLRAMNERVQALGGKLEIDSAPGLGTMIEARVPLTTAFAGAAAGENPAEVDLLPDAYHLLVVLDRGVGTLTCLAEEPPPLKRRVVLKLYRAPLATADETLGFQLEQNALARLEHPAIARLYAVGASADEHYFTMEYVPGLEILLHCERYRLGLRRRIELFLRVCDAVRHCHRQGVVHTNLAASKILVREDDGVAEPRIVGFSHARGLDLPLIAEDLRDADTGDDDPAGTYADIRALGHMLHALVRHKPPADAGRVAELDRIVRRARAADPAEGFATTVALTDEIKHFLAA